MRLVVGPLPASVYWRRRAMVLGAVVLVVTMIVYSCTASGKTAAPPAAPTSSPSAFPSPSPSAEGVAAPVDVVTPSPAQPPAAGDPQICTDAELTVTAAPASASVAKGTELLIKLFIKNTSQRSCNRDVGADHQELYIVLGTQRIWSSDHCDGPTGSEPRTFPPGHERSYVAVWNGHSSTSCATTAKRSPNGPVPDPGEYQLFGRVGTDLSEPVLLTIK